ncbi:MAG: T9SS type A sorting domain-containing protein [Saprospiraceae bacterium]|nr:T9SS type A sorting domain-containing protein [Saprospiraceae bacterium]
MKNLYILFIFMISSYGMIGQTTCEDPNAFTMDTECGTKFDLCIDRYTMDENTTMELQVFTNDMNMFDPCQSFICAPCSNGTLEKLANCNFAYTPDAGFYGNDTFYYAMIINDICTNNVYCGEDDGKIWTVNARYSGPDGLNLKVNSKKGEGWEFVGEVDNLQNGDYFLMDGSHLNTGQTQWNYTFYYPEDDEGDCDDDDDNDDNCIYQNIVVHTSCSEQIMGKDYGLFRVVSGCIATPPNKGECDSQSRNETYTVTSQWVDTTMVVITVFKPLPISLEGFNVSHKNGKNVLEWNVVSSIYESHIDVEKSLNGKDFFSIGKVSPVKERYYSFTDPTPQTSEYSYYRLKVVDLDNNYIYTNRVSLKNKWTNIIQLYPNPTDGVLLISCNGDIELTYQYEIIDMAGNLKIRNYSQENKSTVVHLNNYNILPGMYILRMEFNDGGVHFEKFVYTNE